jgi:hypothetical protein
VNSFNRTPYKHNVRKALTRTTARQPNPNAIHKRCIVLNCGQPTQAFAGKGLSHRFCSRHVRHLARHGSAHRCSYTAAELKPYKWAAERWLEERANDTFVNRILKAIDLLIQNSGRAEIATRMKGWTAKQRARNSLATLKARKIPARRLAVIFLATHALASDDWSFAADREFIAVQIAKQVHRLAARHVPPGMEGKKSVKGALKWGHEVYPYAAGPALRELSKIIEATADHFLDLGAITRIVELKVHRHGAHHSHEGFERERSRASA